jgi:hypothetical protein
MDDFVEPRLENGREVAMGIFSRKKKEAGPGLWEAVDEKQREYAHRLANWLGAKAATVPVKRLRAWVIGVLVVLALVNTANIVAAIRGHHDFGNFGVIKPAIVMGPRMDQPRRVRQSLEQYLDSLRRDSTGSQLLDSLFRVRPGLADSLNEVERMVP